MSFDYRIADITSHEAGRHQIRLAEHEMPGLMSLRAEYGDSQPLAGARIAGSLRRLDPGSAERAASCAGTVGSGGCLRKGRAAPGGRAENRR